VGVDGGEGWAGVFSKWGGHRSIKSSKGDGVRKKLASRQRRKLGQLPYNDPAI
jgi:hypothetical protein